MLLFIWQCLASFSEYLYRHLALLLSRLAFVPEEGIKVNGRFEAECPTPISVGFGCLGFM